MKKFLFVILLGLLTSCTQQLPDANKIQCGIPAMKPAATKPFSFYNYPSNSYQCVKANNREICGYSCKVAGGYAKCTNFPTQHCIVGNANYIACGYKCLRSQQGNVACGTRYEDTCVETQSGTVLCGLNCRVIKGMAKCDPSPPFREEFPMLNLNP